MSDAVGETWKYDPNYHRMAEFLGVDRFDREDYETAKKIAMISDWAGIDKHGDVDRAQRAITQLRKELGVQFIGKTLVTELYKQVRLGVKDPETKLRQEVRSQVKKDYEKKLEQEVARVEKRATAAAKRQLKKEERKQEQVPAPEPEPQPIYEYNTQW